VIKQEVSMTPQICSFTMRRRFTLAALALLGIAVCHAAPAAAQGCGGGPLSTSKGNVIGSLAGGAAGGLVGNQFGSGTGKGVMTGLGVVGGALAGGYVGRQVEGCDHPAQRTAAQPTGQAPRRAATRASAQAAAAPPRTCRSVLSTATIDGREQQLESIACLDPDGVWRTATGPEAERAAQADLVLRTQQRLHDQGFYVRDNIDGHWGPATSNAVRSFQRANGLAANGQIDPPTRTALGLDAAPVEQAAAPGEQPVPVGQ
jgi:hypothetical protein